MTEHDDQTGLLAEYLLGTLSDEERAAVEAALARSPALAAQLQDLEASMTAVTMSLRPPAAPWKQVSASLEGGRRFAHLVPALAAHFDLPEAKARELVEAFDDASRWGEGPGPGLSLMPVEAGPRWDGFLTVVVRLEPGAQLPLHTHASREQVLVLEGGYRDDQSGVEFWRGDVDVREAGTSHSFTAVEGPACLCASIVKLAEDA
jgi:putative transcriptional regulator